MPSGVVSLPSSSCPLLLRNRLGASMSSYFWLASGSQLLVWYILRCRSKMLGRLRSLSSQLPRSPSVCGCYRVALLLYCSQTLQRCDNMFPCCSQVRCVCVLGSLRIVVRSSLPSRHSLNYPSFLMRYFERLFYILVSASILYETRGLSSVTL